MLAIRGLDARASKAHLLEVATWLDIHGRWAMTKADLVAAIDRANHSATAKAARRSKANSRQRQAPQTLRHRSQGGRSPFVDQ